jgi:hypothetical protein
LTGWVRKTASAAITVRFRERTAAFQLISPSIHGTAAIPPLEHLPALQRAAGEMTATFAD